MKCWVEDSTRKGASDAYESLAHTDISDSKTAEHDRYHDQLLQVPPEANRPLGKAHPQQGASGAPYQKTGILNAACNPIGIELLWIASSLF